MKKPFIFGCGICYCGTTSLHRSLSVNNNYLHTGFEKEWIYLKYVFNSQEQSTNLFDTEFTVLKNKIELFHNHKKFLTSPRIAYNTPEYLSVLNKFSLNEINYIFSHPYTLEKYIRYYELLSENSQGTFKSVGDFTNNNINLIIQYKDQFEILKSKLEEKFNLKFLMILRDPIRSYFSMLNAALYEKVLKIDKLKNYNNVIDFIFDEIIERQTSFTYNYNYAKFINYIRDNYGTENVHYVIMEDFFNPNNIEEKYKLEKFLNTQLTSLYPCAFVPDKGINSPKIGIYEHLKDQWHADKEKLNPQLYNFLKKSYQTVYDDFEHLHGSLPADWGRPIDYGY